MSSMVPSAAAGGARAGAVAESRAGFLDRLATRRNAQIILGALWLLDGLLQFQPYMFSNNFLSNTISSMAAGQPGLIKDTIELAVKLASPFRIEFNLMFALTQVAIGIGLIVGRRYTKPALLVAFAWSFVVWWFGEGVGMIPMGMAAPLTGAPGAVMLYTLIGLMIWPANRRETVSAASGGLLGDYYSRVAWGGLWILLAVLQLQPVNRAANAFQQTFSTAAQSSPGPFQALNSALARALPSQGQELSFLFAALFVLVAVPVVLDRGRNLALALGCLVGLFIWITGEYFGGMFTGQGTDPNSGPILILMALVLYRWARPKAVNASS